MDWFDDVRLRARRKNKVLFMPGDSLLDGLSALVEGTGRLALALWALDLAAEAVARLERLLPGEARPAEALRLSRLWARGQVKMPAAKAAILACHAVAKEGVSPEAAALCHAVGQACAVVHARGHALGFAVYELTAIASREGVEECRAAVEGRVREYAAQLARAQAGAQSASGPWAKFLKQG